MIKNGGIRMAYFFICKFIPSIIDNDNKSFTILDISSVHAKKMTPRLEESS
ncbi:hypothetical protein D3C75_1285560 [compost metagenome]